MVNTPSHQMVSDLASLMDLVRALVKPGGLDEMLSALDAKHSSIAEATEKHRETLIQVSAKSAELRAAQKGHEDARSSAEEKRASAESEANRLRGRINEIERREAELQKNEQYLQERSDALETMYARVREDRAVAQAELARQKQVVADACHGAELARQDSERVRIEYETKLAQLRGVIS